MVVDMAKVDELVETVRTVCGEPRRDWEVPFVKSLIMFYAAQVTDRPDWPSGELGPSMRERQLDQVLLTQIRSLQSKGAKLFHSFDAGRLLAGEMRYMAPKRANGAKKTTGRQRR